MPSPGMGVRVRVPASSANLGPGFDSIGLALGLWDEYDISVGGCGLRIEVTGEGAREVPLDGSHLVHRSMVHGFEAVGLPAPTDVWLRARNGIPHGRGLGSSASAIVAGVVAAQAFSNSVDLSRLRPGEPVGLDLGLANDVSSELEGHPDNASASVYGGMTVSWTVDPGCPREGGTGTARIGLHADLRVVVFVPVAQLATHAARAVLPASVPHREAAENAGRAALLVEAVSRRPDLLLPATREWLHQEARRSALPSSMAVVDALRRAGHAAVISGAGPSVLVLTTRAHEREVVLPAVVESGEGWQRLAPGIPERGVEVTRL